MVLAAEVGGRWSVETANFLVSLAKAKSLDSPLRVAGQGPAGRSSNLLSSARVLCFVVGSGSSLQCNEVGAFRVDCSFILIL